MDATYIQKTVVQMKGFEIEKGTDSFMCADVDGDGNITIMDATIIQKYINHLIETLPCIG
jgi:hypothetical protein